MSRLPGQGTSESRAAYNRHCRDDVIIMCLCGIPSQTFLNDILHMSFLAGIHVFKAFPAYTTTEL